MRPGSVVIDISIDQGGCFETSHMTTHSDPTYVVHDVVHYCVGNMPGAVPNTSTYALTNVTLPYALAIAEHGLEDAVRADPTLAGGVNAYGGALTNEPVADAHQMDWVPVASAIPGRRLSAAGSRIPHGAGAQGVARPSTSRPAGSWTTWPSSAGCRGTRWTRTGGTCRSTLRTCTNRGSSDGADGERDEHRPLRRVAVVAQPGRGPQVSRLVRRACARRRADVPPRSCSARARPTSDPAAAVVRPEGAPVAAAAALGRAGRGDPGGARRRRPRRAAGLGHPGDHVRCGPADLGAGGPGRRRRRRGGRSGARHGQGEQGADRAARFVRPGGRRRVPDAGAPDPGARAVGPGAVPEPARRPADPAGRVEHPAGGRAARRRPQARDAAHAPALVRDASAGGGSRRARRAGAAGARVALQHADLHPGDGRPAPRGVLHRAPAGAPSPDRGRAAKAPAASGSRRRG